MADGKHSQLQFIKNSLGVFGSNILVTVLGVGTSVITARVLGPTDRGLFQLLVVLLPTTLSNFVKFGIPQASVYYIRREGASPGDVASNSLWLAFGLGAVMAVVCWFGRDWMFARLLKDVPPSMLPPVLVLVPFVLLQVYFLGVLQALEKFREYNVQNVAPTVLGLFGMAIVLLWMRAGLIGAVLMQSAIIILVSIWLAWRVHRIAPLRLGWNPGLARGMMTFGSKSYVQTLAATLHLRIDQWMIAYFLGPTEVGLYAVAVNLTSLILKIPDATGTVLFPRLAQGKESDAHAATSQVCRHTLFVTGAVGVCFLLFGGLAIRILYGAKFIPAIKPLMVMLPGIVMFSLYLILTRNFTSRAKQGVNIFAAMTGLGLNVGLNWFLIPRFGITGAATSTAISYSVAALILLVMFVRESGYTVGQTVLVRRGELKGYLRLAGRARALAPGAGR